jgi:hypothetical protein
LVQLETAVQRPWMTREIGKCVVGEIVEDRDAAGLGLDLEVELWENRAATIFDLIEIHQCGHDPLTALFGPLEALLGVHVVRVEVRPILLGLAVVHDLQGLGVSDRDADKAADSFNEAVHDGSLVVLDPANTTGPTAARRCITDSADECRVEPVG